MKKSSKIHKNIVVMAESFIKDIENVAKVVSRDKCMDSCEGGQQFQKKSLSLIIDVKVMKKLSKASETFKKLSKIS